MPSRGYGQHMAFNARPLHSSHLGDESHVLVETSEAEVLDFEGCSREEAEAKVNDFLAWAS
jgi:hypothetical protein